MSIQRYKSIFLLSISRAFPSEVFRSSLGCGLLFSMLAYGYWGGSNSAYAGICMSLPKMNLLQEIPYLIKHPEIVTQEIQPSSFAKRADIHHSEADTLRPGHLFVFGNQLIAIVRKLDSGHYQYLKFLETGVFDSSRIFDYYFNYFSYLFSARAEQGEIEYLSKFYFPVQTSEIGLSANDFVSDDSDPQSMRHEGKVVQVFRQSELYFATAQEKVLVKWNLRGGFGLERPFFTIVAPSQLHSEENEARKIRIDVMSQVSRTPRSWKEAQKGDLVFVAQSAMNYSEGRIHVINDIQLRRPVESLRRDLYGRFYRSLSENLLEGIEDDLVENDEVSLLQNRLLRTGYFTGRLDRAYQKMTPVHLISFPVQQIRVGLRHLKCGDRVRLLSPGVNSSGEFAGSVVMLFTNQRVLVKWDRLDQRDLGEAHISFELRPTSELIF